MRSSSLSHGIRFTLAVLHAFFACSVFARAGESIEIDPHGSSVKFVGDAFLHSFHGEAKDVTGSAEIDNAAVPPVQKANLHFKTAALTTFHKERDQKMWGWLQTAVHPEALFSLEGVKPVQGDYQHADAGHPAK